jgi:hypothetical protein
MEWELHLWFSLPLCGVHRTATPPKACRKFIFAMQLLPSQKSTSTWRHGETCEILLVQQENKYL